MGDWPEFFAFGACLIVIALVFAKLQLRASKTTPEDDDEATFLASRLRRRLQVSGLIALTGVLMIVCGFVDPKQFPFAWWTLVLSFLFLAAWIALMALLDALATWSFGARKMRALTSERRLVEAELEKLQRGSVQPGETK